jgi:NAD+ synthase
LMPSQYSSDSSVADAKELCEKFDISYETVSIAPMVEAYENNMDSDKLRIGNFSARMRMSVLYDLSSKYNAIVIGTGNRSEILLGYGTIYGDTACAINPLAQIYKSDEFEFAKFIGVPDAIINKKPSADLWENQSDEDELGYSYKELDDVLKRLVDDGVSKEDLVSDGISSDMIDMINRRIKANEFKGKMPPFAILGSYYKG